jgi:hypothetical protein
MFVGAGIAGGVGGVDEAAKRVGDLDGPVLVRVGLGYGGQVPE